MHYMRTTTERSRGDTGCPGSPEAKVCLRTKIAPKSPTCCFIVDHLGHILARVDILKPSSK